MRVRIRHEKLTEHLSRSRLSQNHWAIRLGLSSGHLSDLVNGRHLYPSPATREKLLRGLALRFEELFDIETPSAESALRLGDLRTRVAAAIANDYIVDGLIGQGGMGTVYLGRDLKHGRAVAIKAVLPDVVEAMGTDRFLTEIRRTALLQHPNILPLLDSGLAAECPYLVTPYVKGGSLHGLLEERGRLEAPEALELLRGICSALDYTHRERIVHCDIKPENVLVSDGQAVVTDFGISRVIHLDGHPRSLKIDTSTGTPAYVSPEQVSGEPVDGRSDQYSVACVAFELLTGVAPFEGTNDLAIVSRRFVEEPPDPRRYVATLPRAVAAVIQRGMAFAPAHRYPSTGAFFADLRDAVHGTQRRVLARAGSTGRAAIRRLQALTPRSRRSAVAGSHRRPSPFSLASGARFLMGLTQDARFALRMLARQPSFAIVAILTLALGVGANTAVFSVINGTLLRSLPYPEPDQLVQVWELLPSGGDNAVTGANFADWASQNRTLAGLSTIPLSRFGGPTTVLGGSEPTRANTAAVARDFFPVMGTQPLLGRTLLPSDYEGSSAPVVVVGYQFWTRYLGADSTLERHVLRIGSASVPVVGVMPPGFDYPDGTDLWYGTDPTTNPSRTSHNWGVIGRLRPGVTVAEAQADLSRVTRALKAQFGDAMNAVDAHVVGLHDALVGPVRGPLRLLLGAAALVLLIACANVASTLLAQGTARQRELAVRAAMGASRARMIGQLVGESFLIALVGTGVGLVLGVILVRGLLSLAPPDLSVVGIGLDATVAGFAVLVCGVSTVVFGLYPAVFATSRQLGTALRGGGRSVAGGTNRPWHRLVAAEVALSVLLLVGSALLIRSFARVIGTDPGFRADDIVTVNLSVPSAAVPGDTALGAYHEELLRSLAALPGVRHVGLVNHIPLGGASINGSFDAEGFDTEQPGFADYRVASEDYFEAMGIPILRGRSFEPSDAMGTPAVAIVNQVVADRYWPNENPVGKRIRSLANDNFRYGNEWITIVGVAGAVRHQALTEDPPREVYVYYRQRPFRARAARIAIKVDGITPGMVTRIRETIRGINPDIPVEIGTLDAVVQASVAGRRFTMFMIAAFGGVALLLAGVGIYGVVTFTVAQRTREMGIRLALGARPARVRSQIQYEVLKVVGVGLILGIVTSFFFHGIIERFLYGIAPGDVLSVLAAALMLAAVAWVASLIPALRATRVDPLATMRAE